MEYFLEAEVMEVMEVMRMMEELGERSSGIFAALDYIIFPLFITSIIFQSRLALSMAGGNGGRIPRCRSQV